MDKLKIFKSGIFSDNPIFVQLLGMCSALAITTSAINGIGMGFAVTVVLVGSNIVISLLKNIIPNEVRIPAFIIVIATFVTIIEMLMHAYAFSLYKSLGVFIPLIVVNCIILGRAESFASKNGLIPSIIDGLGMGVGFTIAIVILGSIRELLGAGSIFGFQIMGANYEPMLLMILPPGAFIALGLLIGLINYMSRKKEV